MFHLRLGTRLGKRTGKGNDVTFPELTWTISRTVMGRKGQSKDITFTFTGVTLGKAKLLADMSKFNAERKNGLHRGTAPFSKNDFDAVITGVATPVGNLRQKV